MNKSIFLLMIMAIGLLSCGDDDKPVKPELDKLTQVICFQGTDVVFFANISYTNDNKVASIDFIKGKKVSFIYVDKKITMINPEEGVERIEYVLGGLVITNKSVMKNNSLDGKVYTSDEYKYKYNGSSLTGASRTMTWPKEGGDGYNSQVFDNEETYSWENNNIVLFTQDKNRIEYTYGTALTPSNFPWRVIPSFSPISFEAFSPINLLYGNRSRNLPESATYYTISGEDNTTTNYTYHFTTIGDYITSMTIAEVIKSTNGTEEKNNYEYRFIYN